MLLGCKLSSLKMLARTGAGGPVECSELIGKIIGSIESVLESSMFNLTLEMHWSCFSFGMLLSYNFSLPTWNDV